MSVDPGSRGWNEHRHRLPFPLSIVANKLGINQANPAAQVDIAGSLNVSGGPVTLPAATLASAALAVPARYAGGYQGAPGTGSTGTGGWQETPAQATFTARGPSPVLIIGQISLTALSTQGWYVGIGIDHAITWTEYYGIVNASNVFMASVMQIWTPPDKNPHTASLYVLGPSGQAWTLWTQVYTVIWCIELNQ